MEATCAVCKVVVMFLKHLLEEKKRDQKTVKAYRRDLFDLGEFLAEQQAQPAANAGELAGEFTRLDLIYLGANTETLQAHLTGLTESCKEATRARKLAAIRKFYEWLAKKGAIRENPAKQLKTEKIPDREVRTLDIAEIGQLLAVIGDGVLEIRDSLMIELSHAHLITVSELLNLKLGQVRIKDKPLWCEIDVGDLGKHQRRTIELKGSALQWFHRYKLIRIAQVQQFGEVVNDDTPFFVNRHRKKMSDRSARRKLDKYLEAAGLPLGITLFDIYASGVMQRLEARIKPKVLMEKHCVSEDLVKRLSAQLVPIV